jgi:hypothetical protein
MNNATYFFDELAVIIKVGNRPGSALSDTHVEALCLHFREVFVLWDGAFLLAQTVNRWNMIQQLTFDMCKQRCMGMQRSIAPSPPTCT